MQFYGRERAAETSQTTNTSNMAFELNLRPELNGKGPYYIILGAQVVLAAIILGIVGQSTVISFIDRLVRRI